MKLLLSFMALVVIFSIVSVNLDDKKTIRVEYGKDKYDYKEGLDKDSKPHGYFVFYDDKNRLVAESDFKHGILVYTKRFDPLTGKKIYEAVEGSDYNLIQVYPKGSPYAHIEYTMEDYLRDNQEQIRKSKEEDEQL